MTTEDFKKLDHGEALIFRHASGHELHGIISIALDGGRWEIKWDDGSLASGHMDEMGSSDIWAGHIRVAKHSVDNRLCVLVSYSGSIPPGYEATGEFRIPTIDDYYLHHANTNHVVVPSRFNNLPKGPRLILRSVTPPWVAPKWMKPGCWLWSNDGEIWHLSHNRPVANGRCYSGLSHCVSAIIAVVWDAKGFTPPPFTGWKESLRQIPESAT